MSEPNRQEATPARSGRWLYVVLLLAAAAVLVVNSRGQASRQGEHHPAVGVEFPPVRLEPCVFAEKPLEPDSIAGKVLLVNFWGTWCPPCREEFPHLAAMRKRFAANAGFVLVSVSCEMSDEPGEFEKLPEETRRYLDSDRASFPVYCDPAGRSRLALLRSLRQEDFAYPTSIVVGADGRVRGVWRGFRLGDELDIASLIEKLLAQPPASSAVKTRDGIFHRENR